MSRIKEALNLIKYDTFPLPIVPERSIAPPPEGLSREDVRNEARRVGIEVIKYMREVRDASGNNEGGHFQIKRGGRDWKDVKRAKRHLSHFLEGSIAVVADNDPSRHIPEIRVVGYKGIRKTLWRVDVLIDGHADHGEGAVVYRAERKTKKKHKKHHSSHGHEGFPFATQLSIRRRR